MAIVIAECCQNHNGDRAILADMVHAAAEAGADYVKIQSIRADDLAERTRFEDGAVDADGTRRTIKRPYQAERARLAPMDLDVDAHLSFIETCRAAGVEPLTTVFTRAWVPILAAMPWRAIKVASYDCASLPLLTDLRGAFATIFVSTGATHDEEIESAARTLAGTDFCLLHCVTIYPTPLDQMHLARLEYLARLAPRIGFSDHSLVARDGLKASIAALALGAEVIERHFSILPPDRTRDGPVSIDPTQLAELVRVARMPRAQALDHARATIPELDAMWGEARRPLSPVELLNRDYYRGRFADHVGGRVRNNWEA